jgi:hypothetical protein
MIDADGGAGEPPLEVRVVLAEVVQQPRAMGRAPEAQAFGAFGGNAGHREEVLGQPLPVAPIVRRAGMSPKGHGHSPLCGRPTSRAKGASRAWSCRCWSSPSAAGRDAGPIICAGSSAVAGSHPATHLRSGADRRSPCSLCCISRIPRFSQGAHVRASRPAILFLLSSVTVLVIVRDGSDSRQVPSTRRTSRVLGERARQRTARPAIATARGV